MADPQAPGAVTGYTQQPRENIDLANRVKAVENDLGLLFRELAEHPGVDQDMLATARGRHREGFMWAVRAIFQPHSNL